MGFFSEFCEPGSLLPSCGNVNTVLILKVEDSDQLNKVTGYRYIALTNSNNKMLMEVIVKHVQGVMK